MERDASVYVEGKRAARRYADDHLGWTHSVDALQAAIERRVDEVGPKEKVVPGFGGNPTPEPEPVVDLAPEPEPTEPEPVEVQPPEPEPNPISDAIQSSVFCSNWTSPGAATHTVT